MAEPRHRPPGPLGLVLRLALCESYLDGGLFPRPPPEGLPVVLGPFGGRPRPPPLPPPPEAFLPPPLLPLLIAFPFVWHRPVWESPPR